MTPTTTNRNPVRGALIVELRGPVQIREASSAHWRPFVGSAHDPWRATGEYPAGADAFDTATAIAATAGLELREDAPSVEIQRAGETGWNAARLGDVVAEGDTVRTGEHSWAVLVSVDSRDTAAPESGPFKPQRLWRRLAAFFTPKAVLAAAVVGVISFVVHAFAPTDRWDNTVLGSIVWIVVPFATFAVIGYIVGRADRRGDRGTRTTGLS